jgi:hypothetical protein
MKSAKRTQSWVAPGAGCPILSRSPRKGGKPQISAGGRPRSQGIQIQHENGCPRACPELAEGSLAFGDLGKHESIPAHIRYPLAQNNRFLPHNRREAAPNDNPVTQNSNGTPTPGVGKERVQGRKVRAHSSHNSLLIKHLPERGERRPVNRRVNRTPSKQPFLVQFRRLIVHSNRVPQSLP